MTKGSNNRPLLALISLGCSDDGPLRQRRAMLVELKGIERKAWVQVAGGGRVFAVEHLNDLPDIASKIGMELRNQYVLGYRPSNHIHDARWRKIKVKLRAPKGLPPLSVYAKTGYYAPAH